MPVALRKTRNLLLERVIASRIWDRTRPCAKLRCCPIGAGMARRAVSPPSNGQTSDQQKSGQVAAPAHVSSEAPQVSSDSLQTWTQLQYVKSVCAQVRVGLVVFAPVWQSGPSVQPSYIVQSAWPVHAYPLTVPAVSDVAFTVSNESICKALRSSLIFIGSSPRWWMVVCGPYSTVYNGISDLS